jgi:hypothetical protein
VAAEAELETAFERQQSGRRPSFEAIQEEGMRTRSDRCREGKAELLCGSGVSIRQFLPGYMSEEEEGGVNLRWFSPVEGEEDVGTVSEGREMGEGGRGGEIGRRKGASQLGVALGSRQIIMPGRRLAGCSSKCSMNVTWKELKMLPSTVSQRR